MAEKIVELVSRCPLLCRYLEIALQQVHLTMVQWTLNLVIGFYQIGAEVGFPE